MNPGETITPGTQQAPPAQNIPPVQQQPLPPAPATEPGNTQHASPFAAQAPHSPAADSITWTASEYISHSKTSMWYLALAGVTALIAGAIYLLTRDYITAGSIVVVGIMFGIVASRKPRVLSYGITPDSLQVGQKLYPLNSFKSFGLISEGSINSILLLPLKRFTPSLTIYYAPDDEDRILDVLSEYLPEEDHKLEAIDRLMSRIRF